MLHNDIAAAQLNSGHGVSQHHPVDQLPSSADEYPAGDHPSVSKQEWRTWVDEKHQLIVNHNHEKAELIAELRTLRQSLNPNTERVFSDLRRFETVKETLENELINVQMQADNFQVSEMRTCDEIVTMTSMFL